MVAIFHTYGSDIFGAGDVKKNMVIQRARSESQWRYPRQRGGLAPVGVYTMLSES
jgi:hypothetical protein